MIEEVVEGRIAHLRDSICDAPPALDAAGASKSGRNSFSRAFSFTREWVVHEGSEDLMSCVLFHVEYLRTLLVSCDAEPVLGDGAFGLAALAPDVVAHVLQHTVADGLRSAVGHHLAERRRILRVTERLPLAVRFAVAAVLVLLFALPLLVFVSHSIFVDGDVLEYHDNNYSRPTDREQDYQGPWSFWEACSYRWSIAEDQWKVSWAFALCSVPAAVVALAIALAPTRVVSTEDWVSVGTAGEVTSVVVAICTRRHQETLVFVLLGVLVAVSTAAVHMAVSPIAARLFSVVCDVVVSFFPALAAWHMGTRRARVAALACWGVWILLSVIDVSAPNASLFHTRYINHRLFHGVPLIRVLPLLVYVVLITIVGPHTKRIAATGMSQGRSLLAAGSLLCMAGTIALQSVGFLVCASVPWTVVVHFVWHGLFALAYYLLVLHYHLEHIHVCLEEPPRMVASRMPIGGVFGEPLARATIGSPYVASSLPSAASRPNLPGSYSPGPGALYGISARQQSFGRADVEYSAGYSRAGAAPWAADHTVGLVEPTPPDRFRASFGSVDSAEYLVDAEGEEEQEKKALLRRDRMRAPHGVGIAHRPSVGATTVASTSTGDSAMATRDITPRWSVLAQPAGNMNGAHRPRRHRASTATAAGLPQPLVGTTAPDRLTFSISTPYSDRGADSPGFGSPQASRTSGSPRGWTLQDEFAGDEAGAPSSW